jgi:hypothetical protein
MAFFGSPLKLSPSSPKRRKETFNWEQCIICQCSNAEPVICMRDVGKDETKIPLNGLVLGACYDTCL